MRSILLAVFAIVMGSAYPARAEEPPAASEPALSEMLPLFVRNHCGEIRDPADQLFCGDPKLNEVTPRLNKAIQERLGRLADRRLAIEENAEWIAQRNSSCGIFGGQRVSSRDLNSVTACLLTETDERIAILNDLNFDCLATNTTAGTLICSDPSLALAETDLNGHVLALISKLDEDDAKDAFAEYARWTRDRDRKCDLAGKDNVPLRELSPSEACLATYINEKIDEIVAAKGDPKKAFGRHTISPSPDADAVDLCVAQIHSANACQDFIRVSRVIQIDSDVAEQDAVVTAEVEMVVLSPFAVCSPVASSCTGSCWDLKSGRPKPPPGTRDSLPVAHRLRIERSFAFQKTDAGGWRCNTGALQPIEVGVALGGGP